MEQLAVCLFLATLAWLAHFSQSRNIGFFSDDQTFAVAPLNWSFSTFTAWLRHEIVSYPEPQGRPLGFVLGVGCGYLGDRLAGVDGMFFIAWLILSLNAVLFFYLLRRCFTPPIPILGAITFLLFPADTTRPFLCHAHILQSSLTFMLIAAHLYLRGSLPRLVLAYIVMSLCLVTYETAVLPLVAIPLLETSRDRQWRRRFLRHIATILLIMAFVGLTRKLGHEYRAEEMNASKTMVVLEIIGGTVIGPTVAIFTFAWRMGTSMVHLLRSPAELCPLLASTAAFGLLLRHQMLVPEKKTVPVPVSNPAEGKTVPVPVFFDSALFGAGDVRRAVEFGGAALLVSYLLSFTHFPPVWLHGQMTSVHVAAAIGGSVLFAAGATAWLRRRTGLAVVTMIAVYFGILFTGARAEQAGFVQLWRERQQFWRQVVRLCPDLDDGTIILCDRQSPQPTRLMPVNCWSDSLVLGQIFRFPTTYRQTPQVSCFPADDTDQGWRHWLTRLDDGRVIWSKAPYGRAQGSELLERNTILLHMDALGNITRASGSVDIGGKAFRLKDPVPGAQPGFAILRFYRILIGASSVQAGY